MRTIQCAACGRAVETEAPRQLYCSDDCRRSPRPCRVDGCAASGEPGITFCSRHKSRKRRGLPMDWRRPVTAKPKTCPVVYATCIRCSEVYVRRRNRAHCADRRLSKSGKEYINWYTPLPDRTAKCEDCGVAVVVRQGEWTSKRCGSCKRENHRERKRDYAHRRRVRLTGAMVEPVYRRKVFERDGWQCGICHRPLSRDAAVPHWGAPTLDHIVPLAAGGEHSYANVQAAHFRCNSIKSDRGAQLRLAI